MVEFTYIPHVVLLLVGLDVIFTYILLDYSKRHDAFDAKDERNILPRFLIGGNPTWGKCVLHSLGQVLLFAVIFRLYALWFPSYYYHFVFLVLGVELLLTLVHYHNLRVYYLNKDNEEYWELLRVAKTIIKRD
jgi:hypothetical protein